MTTDTENVMLVLPSDPEIESAGNFVGNMPGGGGGISRFERDVMSLFDESKVTYKNEWSANTVGGHTFADYDHDGYYDYLEKTDSTGSWLYCGNGVWEAL